MTKRIFGLVLILFALCVVPLCGCNESTVPPESTPTPKPIPTPTPEPTAVPWLLSLGENGEFEDTYLTTKFPSILKYDYSPSYNTACYTCEHENGQILALMYLPEDYLSYDDEFGGFDRDSYARYVWDLWRATLVEFEYTTVDGHEALRSLISYSNATGDEAAMLSYMINVNGWPLTISVTSTGNVIPPEFEQGILDIEFKTGY